MVYDGMPVVRDGVLTLTDGQRITVGSTEWFAWLDDAERFIFEYSPPGAPRARIDVRKEERDNLLSWYAYHKVSGNLLEAYVGRSDTMTGQRLETDARYLITLSK